MSPGRSNEEGHVSNSSTGAQDATGSSPLSSPNTDWGVSTIEPQNPPPQQHQPPTHVSPNPNNPFPSSVSQAPPGLQIVPYAGTPQLLQASDWANMAPDPSVPLIPPHIPDSWLYVHDPVRRTLFPSHRTRLAARRNAIMRARLNRSLIIKSSALEQDPQLSPSIRLVLNKEARLRRFKTNSTSNGITNQTTGQPGGHDVDHGLPSDISFSALLRDATFPDILLPATSVSGDGFERPRPAEVQNHQGLSGDDDGLDTPTRPRGRVINPPDGAVADPGPNLMRAQIMARTFPQYAPGPSGAQDPLEGSSPLISQTILSDPFTGRNDEGDDNEASVRTLSPPKSRILDDNFDVLNQPLLDWVARQCRDSRYRNTPTAIMTYHQLRMADCLVYRNTTTKRKFMINETCIIEYHNPGETLPLVADELRTDRRLIFVFVEGPNRRKCWCRVRSNRILVPTPQMLPPPAEFENVLNLWQYFRLRTNFPSSVEAYAELVAPGYVDRSYDAVNSNILRLGMHPEANPDTAAFRLATMEEAIEAEADPEPKFLLPPNLVPESDYVNPANFAAPAMGIASFPDPCVASMTSHGALPYPNGGSTGPSISGPKGSVSEATMSRGNVHMALGPGGHDHDYLPLSSNMAAAPDTTPISESATISTLGHTPASVVPAAQAIGNSNLGIPVEYHGISSHHSGTSSSHTGPIGPHDGLGVEMITALSESTNNPANNLGSDGNAEPLYSNDTPDVPGRDSANPHFFSAADDYPIDPLVVPEDDVLDESMHANLFEDAPGPNNNNNDEGGNQVEDKGDSGEETEGTEETQDTSDGA
ncbi:hypothetical protein GGR51DRAFT_559102 [Nemania sp. FL0031]|nr:hypothetical protein GGR51DRAFT_559102 [Nemania sp. FL0031]